MIDLLPRIKELLTWTGGGPASFADAIGLPRPVMSHILAGRNKPSLEVVQKILARFPEVHAPWLLLGQGEMLMSLENNSHQMDKPSKVSSEALFTAAQSNHVESAKSDNEEIASPASGPTTFASAQKKVKQVLLMYEDGTFESFNPQ